MMFRDKEHLLMIDDWGGADHPKASHALLKAILEI
jgi:hypothetical protein